MQEINGIVDYLDEISREISIAKGEKLINFNINDFENFKEYILTFKALNDNDMAHVHDIHIKAESIKVVKQDIELSNVFYTEEPQKLVGKKLLEYEDWHTENLVDTGNLSGPHSNLTLIFQGGYSMEIERITY